MLTKEKFLAVAKPDLGKDEEEAVLKVLRGGWLGYGAKAIEFERKFSEEVKVEHAIAVSSATIGLIIALRAFGVGSGDEVITTPLTFAATINAILAIGAKPVFADVNENGLINPVEILLKVTSKTKAILPVHLWGFPCDMENINTIAKRYDLKVIEDAAHSFGFFELKGDVAVFSFYPTKNITCGDGGMIVTNDQKKSNIMRILAAQGLSADSWDRYGDTPTREYQVQFDGYKGQIDDISASIGLAQLNRWPELKEKRHSLFNKYEVAFGFKLQGSEHIYEIRVPNRAEFRERIYHKGIGTGIHYNPLHLEPAYKFLGGRIGDFPIAEKIGRETVSLPLSTTMDLDDIFRVIEVINKGDA